MSKFLFDIATVEMEASSLTGLLLFVTIHESIYEHSQEDHSYPQLNPSLCVLLRFVLSALKRVMKSLLYSQMSIKRPTSGGQTLVGCNLTFTKNRRSGASPIPGFVLNCYVIVMNTGICYVIVMIVI